MGTMIIKILRLIGLTIDHLAAFLLMTVYEMFVQISDAGIFKQSDIRQFSTRIYAFLGLIMVFKVSISLVSYIMNPDNFSKGDVGAPAIIKGFVFALVGIVVVPYIFEIAFSAQRIILKNNIIGNLIMGISNGTNNDKDYMWTAGRSMASTTLRAFIKPNTNIDVIDENCAEAPANCEAFLGLFDKKDKVKEIFSEDPVSPYKLLDPDLLNATVKADGKEVFVMDYTFIISTLCLLFIAYILLLFCFDVAVRAVKLSFLQLIAPIPLIAKIDPKKGGKIFDNWVKECTTTYLDLFFRVAAIFFALFLISSLSGVYHISDGSSYSFGAWIYVEVFLIIGILNFARELPKLLSTILGIDLKGLGGFSLNPFKNKNFAPIGATVGLGSSIASGIRRARKMSTKDENGNPIEGVTEKNLGKLKAKEILGSALTGFGRNVGNLARGKTWSEIVGAQVARNDQLEKLLIDSGGDKYSDAVKSQILSNVLGWKSPTINQAEELRKLEIEKHNLKIEKEAQEEADKNFKRANDISMGIASSFNDVLKSVEGDVEKDSLYIKKMQAVDYNKSRLESVLNAQSAATGGFSTKTLEKQYNDLSKQLDLSTNDNDKLVMEQQLKDLQSKIDVSKSYDEEIKRAQATYSNSQADFTRYKDKAQFDMFAKLYSSGKLSETSKSKLAIFADNLKEGITSGTAEYKDGRIESGVIEFVDISGKTLKIDINDLDDKDNRENFFNFMKA